MVMLLTEAHPAPIYQMKVTLVESDPKIWRQFCVPSTIRLSKLHKVLQRIMGWKDCHLHAFRAGEIRFQIPDPEFDDEQTRKTLDERKHTLAGLLAHDDQAARYDYDFGDNWRHHLTLEKVLPPDPQFQQALCLSGENACPPEDSGGMGGYYDLLEVLADPQHEEYHHMIKWAGRAFDPTAFDLAAINRSLKKIKMP